MKPRVAFWTPILNRIGGTETWHWTLFDHLDSRRVQVVGFGVLDAGECDPLMAERFRRFCPVVAGPAALAELASRADVVVTWGLARPNEILPHGPRPPVIAVSHGDGTSTFTVECMKLASPAVDWFVAVSQAALDGVPADRRQHASVIPNGIDTRRLQPKVSREEQRRAWGVPPHAKVLGFLGRASEEKNPTALAKAIRALPPEWVGVFVGHGTEWADVQATGFATAGTRVFWPGIVMSDDIGSALHAFDVLLVPSHQEGFGQVIAEGWMAGVPVVSTLVGVARERPEWVWQLPKDPTGPEMAAAVQWAARDTFRSPLDEIADLATAQYSARAMAELWEGLLIVTAEAACPSALSA